MQLTKLGLLSERRARGNVEVVRSKWQLYALA